MAIVNSLGVGAARRSAGELTYAHYGGNTISRRRIISNLSNTPRQASHRQLFKQVIQSISYLSDMTENAYNPIGIKSPWSRFVHYCYKARVRLGNYDLPPNAGALAYERYDIDGDFPMSDGRMKFDTMSCLVTGSTGMLIATSYTDFPFRAGLDEGEPQYVNINWYCTRGHSEFLRTEYRVRSGVMPTTPGLYEGNNVWYLVMQMPDIMLSQTAENYLKSTWPVIWVNNQRIGYKASAYFRSLEE